MFLLINLIFRYVAVDEQESYIAFVSGLDIGSEGSLDFKLQLFSDWITGELGDQEVNLVCRGVY